MGKRLLKYRILNPITNINILNKRYELIELFMNSDKLFNIEKILLDLLFTTLNIPLLLTTRHLGLPEFPVSIKPCRISILCLVSIII
jgi:hypothetical protein